MLSCVFLSQHMCLWGPRGAAIHSRLPSGTGPWSGVKEPNFYLHFQHPVWNMVRNHVAGAGAVSLLEHYASLRGSFLHITHAFWDSLMPFQAHQSKPLGVPGVSLWTWASPPEGNTLIAHEWWPAALFDIQILSHQARRSCVPGKAPSKYRAHGEPRP